MARGGDLDWRSVQANFSDSNQAMANSQRGLSEAGNIFSKLTDTILNERQRSIENDLKEREYAERIRQFDTRLGEETRQFGLTHDESVRANQLNDLFRRQQLLDTRATTFGTANDTLPEYTNIDSDMPLDRSTSISSMSGTADPSKYFSKDYLKSMPQGKVNEVIGYADFANRLTSNSDPKMYAGVLQGQYGNLVNQFAQKYNMPPEILAGVIQQESGGRPDAVSPTGVTGIAQVTMPNMKAAGYNDPNDRLDPAKSIDAGARLLAENYKKYGNWNDALVAYNGGDGAVQGIKNMNTQQQQQDDPYYGTNVDYSKMPTNLNAKGRKDWEERERIKADEKAIQIASKRATDASKGLTELSRNIDSQLQSIDASTLDIPEGPEGQRYTQELMSQRQQLLQQKDQVAKDLAMATTESGKQLIRLNELSKMGRGDLAIKTEDERAKEERARSAATELEKFKGFSRSNGKAARGTEKYAESERKSSIKVGEMLSTQEDGLLFGTDGKNARVFVEAALASGADYQDIQAVLSRYNTKKTSRLGIFDTEFQNDLQEFIDTPKGAAPKGAMAEQLKSAAGDNWKYKSTPSASSGSTPESSDTGSIDKAKERIMIEKDVARLAKTNAKVNSIINTITKSLNMITSPIRGLDVLQSNVTGKRLTAPIGMLKTDEDSAEMKKQAEEQLKAMAAAAKLGDEHKALLQKWLNMIATN